MLTLAYGDDPHQVADLHLPAGDGRELPVVVVVHGGFSRAAYIPVLGTPLAEDLVAHGDADAAVPADQGERYAAAARAAGDRVTTAYLSGVDHMALVDPASPAWLVCRDAALLRR